QPRDNRDDDFDDEDGEENVQQTHAHAANGNNHDAPRQQPMNGHGPQPVIEGMPAEVAYQQENIQAPRPKKKEGDTPQAADPQPDQQAAEGEDSAPRRVRRPRRPRNRPDAAVQEGGEGA